MKEDKKRNFGLDLLRSISIISVLLSHFIILFPDFSYKTPFHIMSYFGVEIFFVLSGFLIGGIILKDLNKNQSNRSFLANFLMRRWLRTLPNYYLFLGLSFFVYVYTSQSSYFDFRYILFMQNLITPHPSFMSQAWSLSVEEWFYLSFPLILVAVNLICPDQIRAYIYVALGFVCAAFLLRMGFYLTANTSWDEDVRKVVVFRLDSIAYGILTVYIWDQYNYFIKNNWRKIYAFSLMLASICIYELSKSMKIGDFENAFNYVFLFPITSIMICMVTLIFFEKVKTGGGFFSFVVRIVSQYSYSLYLSHFSVFLPIALYMQGSAEGWIVWLVYWGGSFLMSSLVFHFFESPIMGMRDRLARHALVRSE